MSSQTRPPRSWPAQSPSDEADFRHRARQWRASDADRVHYASKAFLCAETVRWIDAKGLHLDVCSYGEFDLAAGTGFDPARIVLHGNHKPPAELDAAVQLQPPAAPGRGRRRRRRGQTAGPPGDAGGPASP